MLNIGSRRTKVPIFQFQTQCFEKIWFFRFNLNLKNNISVSVMWWESGACNTITGAAQCNNISCSITFLLTASAASAANIIISFSSNTQSHVRRWTKMRRFDTGCSRIMIINWILFQTCQVTLIKMERRSTRDQPSVVNKFSRWRRLLNKPSTLPVQREPSLLMPWACQNLKSR